MECLACHTPNNEGARFCAKCGAPLPASKAEEDPLIGKTVGGRYAVTEILGEGGMGRVYTAEQRMGTSVRKVAVKTLLSQFAKDPQTVARFMREVGTVSELEHPNTIKVYDFGKIEDSGELYIAMEFLQGKSLDDIITSGQPMPPERVDRILGQVCGSLQEAHDKGVVHRDLKPANIYLTTRAGEEDYVKVLDFGIAKKADSKDSKQEQKLTQQGTILGTPPYMSPEQFTGKEIDLRSDIYSLGIITYEMLTGRLPFEAETPWQWMTQHMSGQPFPFESTPAGQNVPFKMKQAVLRALAKDPAQRPSTAREFFEELTLGATRMSAVGLGSGGVGSIQTSPTGTAAFQAPAAGGGRAGGTQVGEPLFAPDAASASGASGTSKTVMGTDLSGQQPYVAAGAPVPTGGGQVYAAPPQQARSSGGPNLVMIALIGFVVIGGGVGGFFWWKGRAADDDGPSKTIHLKDKDANDDKDDKPPASAEPTTEPSTEPSATESATPAASTSASPEASATASATATSEPSATPTTTATATNTAATATNLMACCNTIPRSKKSEIQTCRKLAASGNPAVKPTIRNYGARCP